MFQITENAGFFIVIWDAKIEEMILPALCFAVLCIEIFHTIFFCFKHAKFSPESLIFQKIYAYDSKRRNYKHTLKLVSVNSCTDANTRSFQKYDLLYSDLIHVINNSNKSLKKVGPEV